MHNDNAIHRVYTTEGKPLGELTFDDGYEVWPAGVHGWTHALDCRIEPYNERSLEENLDFAKSVHKQVVVVLEDTD